MMQADFAVCVFALFPWYRQQLGIYTATTTKIHQNLTQRLTLSCSSMTKQVGILLGILRRQYPITAFNKPASHAQAWIHIGIPDDHVFSSACTSCSVDGGKQESRSSMYDIGLPGQKLVCAAKEG
jgi:hypothetical protein